MPRPPATLVLTRSVLVISMIMLMMIPALQTTRNQRERSMMMMPLMNLEVTTAVSAVDSGLELKNPLILLSI
jgi:hypothetical protein